jgi:glycosyltransferase involved in cell wall biosynthesis
VSVLLPVRDAAATLDQALGSLRRQRFSDFEVLVVDDGSVDESPRIAAHHAADDGRIRLFRQPARGLVPALQRGLDLARGPLLARMDADDWAHPARLGEQARCLESAGGLALCATQVRIVGANVRDGFRRYEAWSNGLLTPGQIERARFIESPLVHPTVMVRRQVLQAVGGWRQGPFPEDYELWLRLMAAGHRLAKLPRVLLWWRDGPGRLTRVDQRYSQAAFAALKARYLAAGPLRGVERWLLWGAGKAGRQLARELEPCGQLPTAWLDIDPRKVGRQRRGRPVWGIDRLPRAGELPVLVAVGAQGARQLIRPQLQALGYREGVDCWFCS